MVALLLALALISCAHAQLTPLDEYVRRPDPSYSWTHLRTDNRPGETVHYLNLTSQTWMDSTETTTPLWWHYLTLVVPNQYNRSMDTGLVMIGTGSNTDGFPNPDSDSKFRQVRRFSNKTGTVGVYLRQIPNQPINFVKDGSIRSEDDAIAYTWRRFIENTNNTEILLRMPMCKATVRAMDAATEYMQQTHNIRVQRYMLTGGSKRGWTAWLSAVVDPVPNRVFAVAPKVLSILNFVRNVHHHYQSLGGYTFAFFPYWAENISMFLNHPQAQQMANIIDPYAYRHRLTMPKLYIGSSSDEFFLPDDSHYWFDQMLPPMYLFLVENSGHSTSRSPRFDDIWNSIRNFYWHTATNTPMPTITWQRNETATSGSISLSTSVTPVNITGFWTDNNLPYWDETMRRDFRLMMLNPLPGESGIRWQTMPVEDLGNNNYYVEVTKPLPGWGFRAFFIEVQFASMLGSAYEDRLFLSTEVNIIPDTMPFPRCQTMEECGGELV